ncbi:hypothetical protein [Cellulosilyticum ruminicola]|uniref:hypothetical protein n=1 Tax=Cellulosilyticum ruminicola TaxID=425254 RepID=UPI0006D01D9D|nr:hypothetical protein [Cellulosilyticum ruminicola]
MAVSGWQINLSGESIPVYSFNGAGTATNTKIATITKNECFVEGTVPGTGWEGNDIPAVVLDPNHKMVMGVYKKYYNNLVNFADYASNGTSWVKVSTRKRKVQYATTAYYADGSKCCDLPAGSTVVLTSSCTRGASHMSYCAVESVTTAAGKTYKFQGCGFIDLAPSGRWVNVGSILLRKA